MLPSRLSLPLAILVAWVIGPGPLPRAQAGPRVAQLLPANTYLFCMSPEPKQLRTSFRTTQFWKLLQDENLKPFRDHLAAQLEKQSDPELLGFTLNELVDLAGDEAGYAIVEA